MILTEAISQLRQAIEGLRNIPELTAIRLEVPVSGRPSLNWLHTNRQLSTQWWADRDRSMIRAGLGIADLVTGPYYTPIEAIADQMRTRLSHCDQFCYMGGIRFPSEFPIATEWTGFGFYRFVLPLFEWVTHHKQSFLACNWVRKPYLPHNEQVSFILSLLDGLKFTPEPFRHSPRVLNRHDTPSHWEWLHRVAQVQTEITSGTYQKLVPARKTTFSLSGDIHPAHLLSRLEAQGDCEGVFQFILQSGPESGFVGISPERLYRRVGDQLYTEALAGTDARDQDPAQLLQRPNTRDEHFWVVKMLRDGLLPLSDATQFVSEPRVMTLPRVHHLYQPFQIRLKAGVSDGDILKALYPTPAVAGYPVGAALDRIVDLDHFDRGLYSGIVGIWSPDEVHWAVAIRSAWVGPNRLECYTGAGIVSASVPEEEWEELESKLRPYVEVLA